MKSRTEWIENGKSRNVSAQNLLSSQSRLKLKYNIIRISLNATGCRRGSRIPACSGEDMEGSRRCWLVNVCGKAVPKELTGLGGELPV